MVSVVAVTSRLARIPLCSNQFGKSVVSSPCHSVSRDRMLRHQPSYYHVPQELRKIDKLKALVGSQGRSRSPMRLTF